MAGVALALSACNPGGSGGGSTETASGAVGFDEAQSATAKIEAQGSLVDPSEGALEGGWWGSGLVIDPSGIAVTNNHVVTGAATLNVELDGEEYNARILGTSECLDLAVIDIDGGGLPYFDWYDGEVKAALEVWALGYPAVGDTSFSVTRGIVSKPDTATDTQWASIDHTIEHDARIRGGNSGGPLIDGEGRVVGVNYAGEDTNDLNLAIHRDEVLGVLADLQKDRDVLSLGINGQALLGDGGSGIFVSGVESGSIADSAGLEPGDIILKIEGVTVATDGTMADYCSILRTQGTNHVLAVEVYRPSEDATYVGQFNGEALSAASLPGEGPGEDVPSDASDLTTITDDSGRISVQVPSTWTEVDGREYTDDAGNQIYDVSASSDVEGFYQTWGVSGVSVTASSDLLGNSSVDDVLDAEAGAPQNAGCTTSGREAYEDALYVGSYDLWLGCEGQGTSYVVIAAEAKDGTHLARVRIQAVEGEEWVFDVVANSFQADFS